MLSHRHSHDLVPFFVELYFFLHALVFVLVLDSCSYDRPQEYSFVIRQVIRCYVKTQESFTRGHRDHNEHDFFSFQTTLGYVTVEYGGVSGEHCSNLNAEFVDAAAKIIVREVQVSNGHITVQGVHDVTSALVWNLAAREVHVF